MDLGNVAVGSEGSLKLSLEGGKVILKISHMHASGELSIVASEDVKYFFEKLKVAIPGNWDDLIIGALEGALP